MTYKEGDLFECIENFGGCKIGNVYIAMLSPTLKINELYINSSNDNTRHGNFLSDMLQYLKPIEKKEVSKVPDKKIEGAGWGFE